MKRNFENFSFHENEMNAPNVFNTSNEKNTNNKYKYYLHTFGR